MKSVWQPLKKGSKIAVLPPPNAYGDMSEWGVNMAKNIEKMGFTPIIPKTLAPYYGWYGTPEERAEAIMDVLRNPEISAIFSFGGSGTNEAIQVLKTRYSEELQSMAQAVIKGERSSPPLFGFSDATQLQHFLGGLGVVSPVHFSSELHEFSSILPSAPERMPEEIKNSFEVSLHSFLTFIHDGEAPVLQLIAVNDKAKIPQMLNGSMTVYDHHTIHTDVGPVINKEHANFLLVEGGHRGNDVTDGSGLRHAFQILKAQGRLKDIDAIIISQCDANCTGKQTIQETDISVIKRVVQEELSDEVPVFFGAPFGHPGKGVIPSQPIPLYTPTRITVYKNGEVKLQTEAIRSQQNIQITKEIFDKHHLSNSTKEQELTGIQHIKEPVIVTVMHLPKDKSQTLPIDCIACSVDISKFTIRGSEVPALRETTLKGKNILVYMPPMPMPPKKVMEKFQLTSEKIEQEMPGFYVKNLQLALTELIQTGSLQESGSLTIAFSHPLHKDTERWIKNFSQRHLPGIPVFTTVLPPEISQNLSDKKPGVLHFDNLKRQRVSIDALALDALDPALTPEQITSEPKSWVEKMQSTTPKGSREL